MFKGRIDKESLINKLKSDPESFDEAIKIALSNNQPAAWRATWILRSSMGKKDTRIAKVLEKVVKKLSGFEDGHQREWLKVIEKFELNDDLEGIVFDHCMNIWEKTSLQPSVRFTAFLFILKTAKKYPELRSEVEHLSQKHYLNTLSDGVKRSLQKRIKDFFNEH